MQAYRIKDWDKNYENNRTRELKKMAWVPVPNRHDGDGYNALVDHPDGAAHLGAWVAILQIASKCEMRGTLLRDSATPHTAVTIARMSRLPKDIIASAIERLCSADIAWLEVVDTKTLEEIPQEGAGISQEGASISHPTDYGMEGKGKEGNTPKSPKGDGRKRFVKPTIEELQIYFTDRGSTQPATDAEAFYDHYESNGWKVGGRSTMKDWKAAVRNWLRSDYRKTREDERGKVWI